MQMRVYTHDTIQCVYTHDKIQCVYTHDTIQCVYTHDTIQCVYTHDTIQCVYTHHTIQCVYTHNTIQCVYTHNTIQCVCSRRFILFQYVTNAGSSCYQTTVVTGHSACGHSADTVSGLTGMAVDSSQLPLWPCSIVRGGRLEVPHIDVILLLSCFWYIHNGKSLHVPVGFAFCLTVRPSVHV